MDRPGLKSELLSKLAHNAFAFPSSFSETLSREVSRSGTLHSSDRREITNLAYDMIRWRRRIWGEIAPSHVDEERLSKTLEETHLLFAQPPLSRWRELSIDRLSQELSFPTPIVQEWVQTFGFESAVSLALSMNQPAPVTLRANLLKINREDLIKKLAEEGVEVENGNLSPWAVHLKKRKNIRASELFKKGFLEIQDEASQVSVLMSKARPGDLVIDACCGAGGKALALAAQMSNQGKILSVDSDSRQFDELKKRAKRAGAKIIETVWVAADDPNPLPRLKAQADVVFVDAPCSALGTLRRSPWMKWTVSARTFEELPRKQLALLKRYAAYVKPEGRLCYATCTLRAQENENVIRAFLDSNGDFSLDESHRTFRPDVDGTDGFFVAVITRHSKEKMVSSEG